MLIKRAHWLSVSGAHLNPAVTLALACVRKFPLKSSLHYIVAQYLGAWLGSALVLLTYREGWLRLYSSRKYFQQNCFKAGIKGRIYRQPCICIQRCLPSLCWRGLGQRDQEQSNRRCVCDCSKCWHFKPRRCHWPGNYWTHHISPVECFSDVLFFFPQCCSFWVSLCQVVGTALLLLTVSAVGHNKASRVLGPLIVSFVVMAIGISFGHNAG